MWTWFDLYSETNTREATIMLNSQAAKVVVQSTHVLAVGGCPCLEFSKKYGAQSVAGMDINGLQPDNQAFCRLIRGCTCSSTASMASFLASC